MDVIFAPAIGLMNRLRYPVKFGIIFLIVMIPLLLLSFSLISAINKDVAFLERERSGLAYIKAVRQPIEYIQQHRGMTAAYLDGATEFHDRIMKKRIIVDEKLAELKVVDDELGGQLDTKGIVDDLIQRWNNIKADAMNMTTDEAIKIHSATINDMLSLMSHVADTSEITLDSNLDTAYIGNVLVYGLPNMIENMGQARAIGAGVAAKGAFSNQEAYVKLAIFSSNINNYFDRVQSGLEVAYGANSHIAKGLSGPTNENNRAIEGMTSLLNEQLLNAKSITVSSDLIFNTATKAISGSYRLYDALVPELDRLFLERIEADRATMIMAIATVVIVLFLVAYLFTGFYLSVRLSVVQIRHAAEQISNGDLTVRVKLDTRDEMAQIGYAINSIANGVGQTVSAVISTSNRFVEVADRLANSSRMTGNAVSSQVNDIEEAARAIDQMAHTVEDVAKNTAHAATSAELANDAGVNGQQVVGVAVDSIDKLANDLKHVAGAIHALEEQSQGISGILEVICSIADQTNLLALNAAIEAARAGDQGRGFAVVADEVRGLARRTQDSTLEIQSMIEQLQTGAQDAVKVMEASDVQITNSVKHARNVGTVLQELTGLVAAINDMNGRIAISTEEQRSMAAEINNNINNMTSASEQSAIVALGSVEDSAQAMALASEAQSMLKRFHIDSTELEQFSAENSHVLFQWDDSFSVGIKEIDRQHNVLINLINELYHEVKTGSDLRLLGRILQGLIDYTVSHFGYEEGLMERHGYEDIIAHKAKHKKLVGEVLNFQLRVNANDHSVVDELLIFLNDWLARHIKGADIKYAVELNAKGVD